MNAHRSMLVGLVALGLLWPLDADAAKFRVVGKPTDAKLQASLKIWKGIIKGACDAGNKSACILSRKPTERWENTIKQVLWGSYTEGVSASQIAPTKTSIAAAVNVLFEKNGEIANVSTAKRNQLVDSLYKAAQGKNRAVFAGGIWGAFDADYAHVTIHDRKTNQLFSIYAGYSE